MSKQNLVIQLHNENCRRCHLYKSSKHVCISGRGSFTSGIMLIGEAPGKAEAETGKPFMGRAGQLLNKLLIDIGMSDDCYISNVVRCRPPENRKPTEEEILACQRYLIKEIKLIKPHVIILMGRTAIEALELVASRRMGRTGELPFMVQRIFGMDNIWFIPTWHPAYCLRRGEGATSDLKRSLLMAQALLSGIKS